MPLYTKSELRDTIFADNTEGNISPQNLRDLIDNVQVYGGIGLLNNSSSLVCDGQYQRMGLVQSQANFVSTTGDKLTIQVGGLYLLSYLVQFASYPPAGIYRLRVFQDPDGTPVSLQPWDAMVDNTVPRIVHPGWVRNFDAGDEITLAFQGPNGNSVVISDAFLMARRLD